MSDGVFRMCGREVEDTAAPDQNLILQLQFLVSKAEAGDIHGIAFTTTSLSRTGAVLASGTGYSGEGVMGNVQNTLGGLVVLEHRLLHDRYNKWRDGPDD